MGSRSKLELAYIAGFLDGDGSLMLQLKKRSDTKRSYRFMCTVCFYQDTRNKELLTHIQDILKCGYLSDRNDGITELRINGYEQVHSVIKLLLPFIKLKKTQALALLQASDLLGSKSVKQLDSGDFNLLIDLILKVQSKNYVTANKKTREELAFMLGLTP